MFRSHPMQEVEIIVQEHDVVEVTETLARSGTIHIAATAGSSPEADVAQPTPWQERVRRLAAQEERLLNLMTALGIEAGTPTDEELHWISVELAERDIDSLEREAEEPVRRLNEAYGRLEQLQTLRHQLELFIELPVEIQTFREAQYTFSMLGFIPTENVQRLRTSLEQTPSTVLVIGERGRLSAVGLFGLTRDIEVLRRAARSAYLNPISVPSEYRGTPREVITSLDASIQRIREHISDYQEMIHRLQETRIRRMHHLLWRLRASRHLGETIAGFQKFRYTYLIAGWVPADKVPEARQRVDAASEDALFKTVEPAAVPDREAPFLFDNPPSIRLFEPLVTTYSTPAYSELDPTPLLALTFPLVFGVMFGDVGHGLILLLVGGLLASGVVRRLRPLRSAGGIVLICGTVSVLFGLLYGSFFGFEDVLPALWLRPLERTADILVATVLYGVATLAIGMVYNIIGCILRGRLGEALFSHNGVAGFVFFWSLVGFGAVLLMPQPPVTMDLLLPLSVISGSAIAFGGVLIAWIDGLAREQESITMAVTEGFFELFETAITLMSNTLSYVRMGAFAVAHGALSLVVFIMAELVSPGQGIGYWLVVVLGNAFVIGFEGMIVAIQTLRLEYYELFSKFFTGGGVPYSPLGML